MRATGMYLKPIVGENLRIDPKKVLNDLKRELQRRLKAKLLGSPFSARAKEALSKSIQIHIKPSSLVVVTDHPGFMPLVKGMTSRQMTWLTKAKHPIPIMTDSGKLIFRSATPKSMADGKWVHPGHQPTGFLEQAKAETRAFVKQKITKEMVRMLRATIRESR